MPIGNKSNPCENRRMNMAKKNDNIVVLDIGGAAIRGAEVSYDKNNIPTIHKIGEVPLKMGVVSNGEVQSHDALVIALRELWDKTKFTTNKLKFGLEGTSISTRSKTEDWVSDKDFEKIIAGYAQKLFNLEQSRLSEYYFKHHTISEYVVDETRNKDDDFDMPGEIIKARKKSVIIAAAERSVVDAFIAAMHEAKLKPVEIDFNPFALIRSSKDIPRKIADAAEVSIDIGSDLTTIVIHTERQPIYVRTIASSSGKAMSELIQESLGIESFGRAEARKLKIIYSNSLDADKRQQFRSQPSVFVTDDDEEELPNTHEVQVRLSKQAKDIARIVMQETSKIINAINETLSYYKDRNRRIHRYSHVTLSGGLAHTPKIVGRMGEELKTHVDISNPFLDVLDDGVKFVDKGTDSNLPYPDSVKGREHLYTTLLGLTIKGGYENG